MSHRFVAQPYDDGFQLRDFFEELADDPSLLHLDVVVAWVKRTGLRPVASAIEGFRERGGTFRAIAGISQGGTSKQGLAMLIDLADQAFVFHDPARTFHPKVYAAYGQDRAVVLVGSHNLTGGGVSANYEAGIISRLDLASDEDLELMSDVSSFVERLLNDAELCVPLDSALLAQLKADRRYRLSDEESPAGTAEPVEDDATSAAELPAGDDPKNPPIFGTSRNTMRPRTVARTSTRRGGRAAPRSPRSGTTDPDSGPIELRDSTVRRWFKVLPASDAQQLAGSNPSNTMTLVQARHPIDASEYFRSEFFGSEVWTTSETAGRGQEREVATIECEVFVRGVTLGVQTFDVRHTPGYDADQANRTSELAWREFGEYLRSNPLTGLTATLEKTASGRYRLLFDDDPPGPFLY